MKLPAVDDIIRLQHKILNDTPGAPGLRDAGLLESAVLSIAAAFDDFEVYPTIEEKAARLAFALVENHAFVDANKRVGVIAMLMTLSANGIELDHTQQELIDLGFSIADGTAKYDTILRWIQNHKQPE